MTKETALRFLDRVEEDKEFREKLLHMKNKDDKLAFLKKEDFVFSEKDFNDAMQEKYHTQMTKEEMEKIVAAGGKGPTPSPEIMLVSAHAGYFSGG